ncbi:MAG: hypothetical protein ACK5LL_06640, partial [Suipraeoptans sp.]
MTTLSKCRIEILGCPMHAISRKNTVEEIKTQILAGNFTQHVVINVAKLIHMRSDNALKRSV